MGKNNIPQSPASDSSTKAPGGHPNSTPAASTKVNNAPVTTVDWSKVKLNFKDLNFKHSFKSLSKNKRTWRNLKQIISLEQSLAWPDGAITFSSIDAPPSFRPAKKYSDISGLEAAYTDPHTKLRFAAVHEYAAIKRMPGDIVAGYLTLRKANAQLQ